MSEFKKEIEAILFSAGRTVTAQEFQAILGLKNPGLVKESMKELIAEYQARESPLMFVEEGLGWKLTVRESFLPIVQKINPHTELSKTILETLSVIAWKQPALQSDVIKIRTNKAYDHIAELERLGFVAKEKHGRSFRLKVTQKFLDYFDLPNAQSIKEVFKEFKDMEGAVQKKMDDFQALEASLGGAPVEEGSQQDVELQAQQPVESVSPEHRSGHGKQLETYSDELPRIKGPNRGEIEIYERTLEPEQREKVEITAPVKSTPKKEEDFPQDPIDKIEEELSAPVDETTEEKAKRLAQAILEDKHPLVAGKKDREKEETDE